MKGRSAMSLGTTSHLIVHHRHVRQTVDQMTGHHTIIGLSSKLLTSYIVAIKCLVLILTLYSTYGPLLWLLMETHHHSQVTLTCIMLLTQLPSATFHGRRLVPSTTVFNLKAMCRHG